jgi:hypothetical protein
MCVCMYVCVSVCVSCCIVSGGPKALPVSDPFSRFCAALIAAPARTQAGLTAVPAPAGAPAAAAPAAVGHLVTLPANTFLFGLQKKGQHLYIRPCYLQLLEIIIGYFNTDTTGILVTGIPGVGKSFFAAFLLMHYLKQAVTIVYEDAKRGGRWLIIPGAPVQEGGLQDFTTELNLTTTLYICDVGGENSPEPVVCNALTVVLSSPDPAHYQEWLKEDDVTLYMPVWSAEEVTAVVPTVYPQRTLADGVTSIYPGRLNLYGGIARNIFRAQTDDKLERKLEKRIKACNLVKLYKSIEAGERIKSLKLLQYVLGTKPDGTPDFEDATLDFASDEICERVMKQKETTRMRLSPFCRALPVIRTSPPCAERLSSTMPTACWPLAGNSECDGRMIQTTLTTSSTSPRARKKGLLRVSRR